jgi:non-specific serine/threonine protein kinase
MTATSGEAVLAGSQTSAAGAGRSRRLVGRDRELAEIAEAITASPLTTVTGAGGVGKTALALAVAAASSAHFPDGVFVVWLASLRSADLVAGEVAAQVGMQRSGGQSNEEALARWLADRDVLLVLDNCEHVVSAVAELVEDLTARLPRLHVLATSREPLWVVDEVNHRLAPLPEADAVQLFQERAGNVAQAALDSDTAVELVCEICRRVDGLPLAIELAAARVVGLDLQDISRHLDHLFELLPQEARRADGVQRSLRATVEWSDALLMEDERLLLRRMAVFAGGFDLIAINAVCAGDGHTEAKVADLTARLVEKSLLLRQADTGSYQLLETIRQYSAEQLALAGELDLIRDRHARFYLELGLREADATQAGPERAHLEVLRRVEDNTRVALERLLALDPEAVLALAANLNLFWWSQGRMREGRVWLERGREAAADPPAELRAAGLFGEAFLVAQDTDDWSAAAELVDIGIEAASDTEKPPLVLAMLHGIRAECDAINGDPTSALARATTACELASGYPGSWGEAYCVWQLGNARRAAGDEAGAIESLREGNELSTALGTGIGEMICCNDLGELSEARGELDRARSFFDRSLQVRQELGAVRMGHVHGSMASSLLAVARVAEKQGDTATASQLCHDAIPFAQESREYDIARQIDELLRRLSQSAATSRAMLRPEDGTWHIQYNGTDVHMPDLKGLWHLRELLARPHQPVAALSLIGASSGEPLPTTDTGPVLDREALRQYRRRLAELDDEIDAAALRGDRRREAERAAERKALIEELKRATGLGGRPRQSGSPAEKARVNVTRTIRHAIRELASRAPDLAVHLEESIVTGVSCCYEPKVGIVWTT